MKKICFVVMPFGTGEEYQGKKRESDFILKNIVEPAVKNAVAEFAKQYGDQFDHQLEIVRELDNVSSGDITESIIRHLAESYISIVDMTGRNPNVFFELGVRFALRRNGTILLVQNVLQVPFNVRNFRVVEYDPLFDGIEKAVANLQTTILKTLQVLAGPAPATTDSLVFQALHDLKISGLGFIEEAPETDRVTWDEYWARIVHIEDTLNQLRSSGVYEPDIIVGISNGGLFLTDTTLRLVYGNKVPTICLWALRSQERYFDNPLNNALITRELLEELVKTKGTNRNQEKIKILVMDDIVGTTRTFSQLVEYFKNRLGDFFNQVELRFVFLFSPRAETLESLSGYLLSSDPAIISKYKQVDLEISTLKRELPYRKSIHYGDITKSTDSGNERQVTSVAALTAPNKSFERTAR